MSQKQKNKLTKSLTKRWKPRSYQQMCVDEGLKRKFLAFFIDPGLGKTSITLQIFNKRKLRGQVKAMLVVAPLNPCYMTWGPEIKEWTNFRRFKSVVLHGPMKEANLKKQADIYIINPEGLQWLATKLKGKRKVNWPFDMLVVDESSKFKSADSSRSKLMHKMAPAFPYRYILNGTPVANGYMGLMSQMRIVDQGQSLGAKITYYRQKYFEQYGKPEWRMFKLSKGADKRIMKKIAPFAVCLKAEDHVDMPKVNMYPRFIKLNPRSKKLYDEIETEFFAEIDNKELIAESASSLATKLHQICNGSIYEDQDPLGKPLPSSKRKIISLHSEKLSALEDLIDEFNGKPILIGYKFQHDKTTLKNHFKNKIKFFDDAKTEQQKVKLQKDWNAGKIDLLAGNPQSVGHGLNLQKGGASVICMYSIDHDYEIFDQFRRRLYRSGNSANSVSIALLVAEGLYDHMVIYPNLVKKKGVQDSFMDRLIAYRNSRK